VGEAGTSVALQTVRAADAEETAADETAGAAETVATDDRRFLAMRNSLRRPQRFARTAGK
jgi:hypothetical protein